ncbi:AAA family ATPase [Paenibacillus sp. NRS-1775]|uniref:AAA family ATPase n=1 Tax=unclassified Paenibacillus TaxID=185978 RepID=UPI003D26725C
MRKVFLLMGYSGSGKTKIAKALEGRGYNILQSYTTRQPRSDGEWGHTFTTVGNYEKLDGENEIIAYSYFDNNHYFSTKEQLLETDVYVIDPDGIKDLKRRVPDIEFVTIYLKVDKQTRYERMIKRGDDVNKRLKRINEDGIKFRNKRFDYQVINYELDKAVNVIDQIIKIERNE